MRLLEMNKRSPGPPPHTFPRRFYRAESGECRPSGSKKRSLPLGAGPTAPRSVTADGYQMAVTGGHRRGWLSQCLGAADLGTGQRTAKLFLKAPPT